MFYCTIDLLLVFSDVCPVLQNKVSLLCESWWTCKLEHKEQVVPNTVLYLVVRSLGDKAKVSVYSIHVHIYCKKRKTPAYMQNMLKLSI